MRPADARSPDPQPGRLEHRPRLLGDQPLGHGLLDQGRHGVERGEGAADADLRPPLDRLELDLEQLLVGPGQLAGPDLVGGDDADQRLHDRIDAHEVTRRLDLLRRRLARRAGFRKGEGQGMERPVLGREREALVVLLQRPVQPRDFQGAEADDVAVDRLGTASGVGEPAAAGPHPGLGNGQSFLVERHDRAGRDRDLALDHDEPRRHPQPRPALGQLRVQDQEALTRGEIQRPVAALGGLGLQLQDAEGCTLQGGECRLLLGAALLLLPCQAVDRGGAGGRRVEQAHRERQGYGIGGDRRVVDPILAIAQPVPGHLLHARQPVRTPPLPA